MTEATTLTANDTLEQIDLQLTGMTCAACAMRIEKKLNRLDGVTATVNYATERATVAFEPTRVNTEALITAVHRSATKPRCRRSSTTPTTIRRSCASPICAAD